MLYARPSWPPRPSGGAVRNADSEYPRSAAMASMSLSSRAVASRTTPAGVPPSGGLEKAVYRSTSGRGAFVVMLVATRCGPAAIPGRGWRRVWAPAVDPRGGAAHRYRLTLPLPELGPHADRWVHERRLGRLSQRGWS